MPLVNRLNDPNILNVDVVVCVKNQAKALNRVLRQIVSEIPFKNLIVIYGTSIDDTREIARKYTNMVFWDGDRGLGAARNLGMKKAASEIVAMIDSDVILTRGWYKKLIRHFKNPKVAAAMGTCIYGYGCSPLERLCEYWRWRRREDWGCHNIIFRRDVVLGVGNFDETIRGAEEDYDLYSRLLDAGYKWVWDRNVVVYHPANMGEYLNHVHWWAQGPHMHKIMREAMTNKSLLRIYCGTVMYAFRQGIILSVCAHPTMLLYFPLIRIVQVATGVEEVRKRLKPHHKRI